MVTISQHRKPTHLLWTTSALALAIGLAPSNAHAQSASPAAAQPVAKQDGAKPQKAAQKRRLGLGDKSLATPIGAPGALAFVTKAPAPALAPAWTGFYAGVTFGPTLMKAALTPVTQSLEVFTDNVPSTFVLTNTTIVNQVGNSSGSGWGALADGHLGYNFRLGGNVVAGMQGEVTLSGAQTQTSGVTTTLNNFAQTRTPPLGPGQLAQRTTLTNSSLVDAIGQRWAASALARLGVLVDPGDLLYVIGGYTYGNFLWGSRVFGANGATIGGGIEREIAPAWTVRAEYRYTAFENKDLPRGFSQTNVTNSVPPGQETLTDFFTQANPDHVSGLSQQTLRFGLSHSFGGNAPAAPGAYAQAGSLFAPLPAWQGFYGGVSFGPAWTKASTSIAGVTTSSTGAVTNSLSQASGNGRGAQSDVYLGYNFRLGSNVLAGLQAEGTIADNQTPVNPTETDVTTAGAATTVSTSVGLLSLQQRWGASALARLGALADSRDLIYAIGGYTYGNFLWNGRVFGANGATIGAGWEHEVAPSWTLKAEYRYTAFANTDISLSSNSATNTTSVTAGGRVTTTSTSSAAARTGHIAGLSEQALRFGISHYFNSAPGVGDAPGAYALVTKAKAAPAPTWTGLYGGVSAGLLTLAAHTTTVQPSTSIFNQTVPGDNISDVLSTVALFDASGRQAGATADIFLGYNTAGTAQLIAGVQVEGGLAHASVLQDATLVAAPQIETTVETPSGGPASTTVFVSNGAGGGGFLGVQSRWMASALAKAGWLVDPHNLVYVIGGWTYGAFNSIERPFGLNGPTVGGGIEREIAPAWTLRAEYRYAHFQGPDVTFTTSNASTQTAPGVTTANASTLSQTDHISATTHAVRLGLAHYFGSH